MNTKDLTALYRSRFGGREHFRQGVWRILAREYFVRWIDRNATILDLGCGYCEFINEIPAKKKYGMDLNPEAHRHAAKGVLVLEQDCSITWTLPDASLDVIFTSKFFEHLPGKTALESAISEAFRCLKPGGRIISMGPNVKHITGAYWDFFDHHIPLTEKSVSGALADQGFGIEQCIGRFLPYTMSDGVKYPLWTLRVYLRFPPLWKLFGRQFLVIARKAALSEAS